MIKNYKEELKTSTICDYYKPQFFFHIKKIKKYAIGKQLSFFSTTHNRKKLAHFSKTVFHYQKLSYPLICQLLLKLQQAYD